VVGGGQGNARRLVSAHRARPSVNIMRPAVTDRRD
jgi:hypothetical protein